MKDDMPTKDTLVHLATKYCIKWRQVENGYFGELLDPNNKHTGYVDHDTDLKTLLFRLNENRKFLCGELDK